MEIFILDLSNTGGEKDLAYKYFLKTSIFLETLRMTCSTEMDFTSGTKTSIFSASSRTVKRFLVIYMGLNFTIWDSSSTVKK